MEMRKNDMTLRSMPGHLTIKTENMKMNLATYKVDIILNSENNILVSVTRIDDTPTS